MGGWRETRHHHSTLCLACWFIHSFIHQVDSSAGSCHVLSSLSVLKFSMEEQEDRRKKDQPLPAVDSTEGVGILMVTGLLACLPLIHQAAPPLPLWLLCRFPTTPSRCLPPPSGCGLSLPLASFFPVLHSRWEVGKQQGKRAEHACLSLHTHQIRNCTGQTDRKDNSYGAVALDIMHKKSCVPCFGCLPLNNHKRAIFAQFDLHQLIPS